MASNKPAKVITLGRWSAGIFVDQEGRYSVNIRRNIPKEEIERMEKKPESILIFEDETLVIRELADACYQWIFEQKMRNDEPL